MTRIAAALAVATVLATAACAAGDPSAAATNAPGGGAPASLSAEPAPPSSEPAAAPTGPRPIPAEDALPVRLRIPAIGVDSALETLQREESGQLAAPHDWQTAGWFDGGPVPGSPGPAVIAGHVDSPDGPAVFAELARLRPGDQVTVDLSDGTSVTFDIDGGRTVPQARFPTDTIYGPVPDSQLRLITCHTFDETSGHYVDNLVVFATAASALSTWDPQAVNH